MRHVGCDELAAALEEKIRQARFYVAQHDEGWGYVMDRAMEPGDAVLSTALPINEAVRRVSELRARPYKYMWMKSTASPEYLSVGSAVVHRPGCGSHLLVMTPAEHASWQHRRLRSGRAADLRIYETAAEALVELAEARALGVIS
jgi:hypothetical protein